MPGRPLVSAAIIAKNEERFLDGCLRSLRGVADEVVVVDTGSTDATCDIATAYGARLDSYPWDGNFSNARNRALELVSGEWVLYIDCDEQIDSSPEQVARVRARLTDADDTVGFLVLFAARVGSTPYREYRLWRNRDDIRFHGVIHESMVTDLRRISRDEGLAIAPLDLRIQHYGYEGDLSHKHARNLPLLREQIGNDPRRVYLWWHLGFVLHGLGRRDEAYDAWRQGVRIVREDGWKSPTDLSAYGDLAYCLAQDGEPIEDLVAEGLAFDPRCYTLHVAALISAHRHGRTDEVERLAALLLAAGEEGVQSDIIGFPQRFFDEIPLRALAETRWEQGDVVAAAQAYGRLLELQPENTEYRAKAAIARAAAARVS